MKLICIFFTLAFSQFAFSQEDNKQLLEIFNHDQKMRTKENMKNWPLYSLLEERGFRIKVFNLLVNRELITSNDYFRAAIILQHGQEYTLENYILAAKLSEKSIELGHKDGQFALDAAISKYSLSDQLPSEEWTLYSYNNRVVTKQILEQSLSKNTSTTNIKTQK